MSPAAQRRLADVEYWLLCALALVLPLLEAPKNVLLVLILVTALARRLPGGGGPYPGLGWVGAGLLAMIAASALSTAVNWPFENGTRGLKDVASQCLVFWAVYSAGLRQRQKLRIAEMVVVGVLAGLAWGAWDVVLGRKSHLQFHSAGIVSQSALYLGIAFVMTLSIAASTAYAGPRSEHPRSALWWASSGAMLAMLLIMGSRGPIIAALLSVIAVGLASKRRKLLIGAGVVAAAGVILSGIVSGKFDQERAIQKTEQLLSGQLAPADAERVDYWRIALKQVAQGNSLVFGVGPRNYAGVDYSRMHFDPPLTTTVRPSHAHNLFLTKLVEEGVLGLGAFLFFLGAVAFRLLAGARRHESREWTWSAAVGALIMSVVAGSVNTPWYQEHALLAMMLLALCLAPGPPGSGEERVSADRA
jgi:O-antigen ligase